MNILDHIKRFPGGLMVVPMFVTALINTFCPSVLQIGGPTTGLFTAKGTMAVIGIILFITGSQFKLEQFGMTLKRGGVLCIAKVCIGFAAGLFVLRLFGQDGFWGISAVAFTVAMVSTNPGVYIALAEQYGDGADKAAFGLLNVVAVPATPILVMGAASGAGIDYMSVVATLTPFVIGMIVGNLDPKIRGLMAPGTPIALPFLGFCFGASVNLRDAALAGISGLVLAAAFLIINVGIMLAVDRLVLRRPGYASVATCSVAGISVVVPSMLAASDPIYLPYVGAATAQLAMTMVITSFAAPWITKAVVGLWGDQELASQSAVAG